MTKLKRTHIDELRGMTLLAIEATKGVIDIVEDMHRTIASGPGILGQPLRAPAGLFTRFIYGGIREVTHQVGLSLDAALNALAPLLGDTPPGVQREALVAALNGVLGDYLEATQSPLAIEMQLRHGGQELTLERKALRQQLTITPKILVLVHGSSLNDLSWKRLGHDHGAELAKSLGYTPIYLHYNSGRHISDNGRDLSLLLEQLVTLWPGPIQELTLLAHSMGGLVSRSACYSAEALGHQWRNILSAFVCLGSPHHGAPLERGGNIFEQLLAVSRYSAPLVRLGKIRSAGVTDMRFGIVRDQDWAGRDRFAHGKDPRHPVPLPRGVRCYAIAGTRSQPGAARLLGDGMVTVRSALGQHKSMAHTLAFARKHQFIAHATSHLDLLNSQAVYQQLRQWLEI